MRASSPTSPNLLIIDASLLDGPALAAAGAVEVSLVVLPDARGSPTASSVRRSLRENSLCDSFARSSACFAALFNSEKRGVEPSDEDELSVSDICNHQGNEKRETLSELQRFFFFSSEVFLSSFWSLPTQARCTRTIKRKHAARANNNLLNEPTVLRIKTERPCI